ncbi:MAG: hypothetical protein ABJF01_05995 [bacterium]
MRLLIISLALACAVAHADGQLRGASEVPARLGPDARAAIQRLIDSARVAGLPTAPLADKAAEGVLKGADDRRVLSAVQTLLHQLIDARDILGRTDDVSLLGATASALQAGVPVAELRRLAAASRGSMSAADSRALAGALVTLVDLVAKRVPPAAASASIEELLRRHATEEQFVVLRGEVERDILGGQSPEAALAARTRAQVKALDALSPSDRTLPRRPPPG